MPPRALRVTLGTLARLTHADGRGKGLLTGVFRKSCFRVVRTGFGLHGQDPLRTVVDLYNFARPDLHRTVRSCPLRWCVVAMICRFVTHAGNARSFPLCLLEIMIVAAAEAYAAFRVGDNRLNALLGSRHASLYPPSRRRTTLHHLPKLCGPADVRQGRHTALEHGEDRLYL